MEIWILLLASGFIGCFVCEAYETIQMNRWMRQRHLRELKLAMRQLENPEFFSRTHDVSADEIRKALDIYKSAKVTTTLPTGEVEVVYKEEMNEAEKLIEEANNRSVD